MLLTVPKALIRVKPSRLVVFIIRLEENGRLRIDKRHGRLEIQSRFLAHFSRCFGVANGTVDELFGGIGANRDVAKRCWLVLVASSGGVCYLRIHIFPGEVKIRDSDMIIQILEYPKLIARCSFCSLRHSVLVCKTINWQRTQRRWNQAGGLLRIHTAVTYSSQTLLLNSGVPEFAIETLPFSMDR